MSQPARRGGTAMGVRIAGAGLYLPEKRLTNADFCAMMDTSDEWIVQRTGVRERRKADPAKGETVLPMAREALRDAIRDAAVNPAEIDLVVCATMTQKTNCPPASCRLAAECGCGTAGGMDINGACCGFVFALNTAAALVTTGAYRNVGVVGVDTITDHITYDDRGRSTCILFGDAAGAVVLKATDDTTKGVLAHEMHSDGARWTDLYIAQSAADVPEGVELAPDEYGLVQMNGRAVFKFAVGTFSDLIASTLDKAGVAASDVAHYVCHQSNARILQAARERFGLPEDKLIVNIDRYGNTVAASVPLCFAELKRAGKLAEGQKVMFVGFGAGLTWGSSLWQL